MKKLLSIFIIIFFIPLFVNAEQLCKVVSGNGKDLGSEVACGSEHFYILSSTDTEIRMLAKYNLYTGITIHKEIIEKEAGDTRSDSQYCSDLATEKGGTVKSDGFYNDPGYCFYKTDNITSNQEMIYVNKESGSEKTPKEYCLDAIKDKENYYFRSLYDSTSYVICEFKVLSDKILQSKDAKSAHWDADLNYLYPQVGDVYIGPGSYSGGEKEYKINTEPVMEDTRFYDYDLRIDFNMARSSLSTDDFQKDLQPSLYIYREELKNDGFELINVDMLSISELNTLIEKISSKSLPLKEWGENLEIVQGEYLDSGGVTYGLEIHFGDLKPYIPSKYKWLYSTTYWNSTAYKPYDTTNTLSPTHYYVFTAEQGKLCGAGFALCAPETALGCGIRPLITIANNLEYLIKTNSNGNGEIEVVENSKPNEQITFKLKPNEGYKLDSVVITTDTGETVEFTEDEIIKNDDGTVSVINNKFTMPNENVTINVKWESTIKVPDTLRNLSIMQLIVIVSLLSIGIYLMYKKYKTEMN